MSAPRTLSLSALLGVQCLAALAVLGVQLVHRGTADSRQLRCVDNLKTIGQSLHTFADNHARGDFCTGAPDLHLDDSVDLTGWVADGINSSTLQGKDLTCPSNQVGGLVNLNDQLNATAAAGTCWSGIAGSTEWDGFKGNKSSCFAGTTANSPERQALLARSIVSKGYNTNYTASWFLARSIPRFWFDDSVSPMEIVLSNNNLQPGLRERDTTLGPLCYRVVDTSPIVSSLIPILGDSAATSHLVQKLSYGPRMVNGRPDPMVTPGEFRTVTQLKRHTPLGPTLTNGPASFKDNQISLIPGNATLLDQYNAEADQEFDRYAFLQDTRGWQTAHFRNGKQAANLLMADGSVKTLEDLNGDTYLNPGFEVPGNLPESAYDQLKYRDSTLELPPTSVFSGLFLISLQRRGIIE